MAEFIAATIEQFFKKFISNLKSVYMQNCRDITKMSIKEHNNDAVEGIEQTFSVLKETAKEALGRGELEFHRSIMLSDAYYAITGMEEYRNLEPEHKKTIEDYVNAMFREVWDYSKTAEEQMLARVLNHSISQRKDDARLRQKMKKAGLEFPSGLEEAVSDNDRSTVIGIAAELIIYKQHLENMIESKQKDFKLSPLQRMERLFRLVRADENYTSLGPEARERIDTIANGAIEEIRDYRLREDRNANLYS